MREIVFALKAGKGVPEKFDGAVVRGTGPDTLSEYIEFYGGPAVKVAPEVESAFRAGLEKSVRAMHNLYTFQKPAKTASAKADATLATITAAATAKPSTRVRTSADPVKAEQARARKTAGTEVETLLAEVSTALASGNLAAAQKANTQLAAARKRLADLSKKTARRPAATVAATSPATTPSPEVKHAPTAGKVHAKR